VRRLAAIKWRLLPLAVAAAVLCIPVFQSLKNKHEVSKEAQAAEIKLNKKPTHAKFEGTPNRIIVPRLSIDLPVDTQTYSYSLKSWPVSTNDANYAKETAQANNQRGETLIYGHDTRHVFGPLSDLQPNDTVYVYTDNGHIFKYAYQSSQDITPTKLSIIDDMAKAPAGLKLITCSGDYFQYRRVMSLKLLQAS
jgi:sortase (surface protein transpeptidase)